MPEPGPKYWFHRYDWDAVAGVVAAAAALILHLLHVINPDVLLTLTPVLVALLLLRQIFHVQVHSELIAGLVELERSYRMAR